MIIFIWCVSFFLMGLWSLLSWLSVQVLQWAGQLPWEQTLQRLKDLPVPAVVAPWWQQMVDVMAPLLQMTQGLLSGLMQFAGSALPFIVGAVWLFGMLAIIVLTVLISGGVWWFKRKRANTI